MEKVKAGLRGLSALDKVTQGRVIHKHLSGNPHFPGMAALLAELQAVTDDLNQKNIAALDRGRMACALKRSAIAAFDPVVARIAAHVNSVAAGDVEKLVTTGFPMARRKEPINELDAPTKLATRHTYFENKIELRWKRVPGALVYEVEMCAQDTTANDTWQRVTITSRPKAVVDRRTNERMNAFRICAVGSSGQGPYSQVIFPKAA